ncbi:MAG: c-type cytochrome, partial [Planctomycetota bacterium]|nr:c-type cytochrome [Planctomycetota bacterium]
LNGVFNHSHVQYTEVNPNFVTDHPGWEFTCALWRVHPITREFQVFAEGTSNPWGLVVNDEGDFFVSACVVGHLWHLVESAYYVRQGGSYPAHVWPLPSIVQHAHQQAAYCGMAWFDTDAYPNDYRRMLLMGNIHGGCINADRITRDRSSYQGSAHPGFPARADAWDKDEHDVIRKVGEANRPQLADFLSANDPWFMPVAQFTGPDGHFYVLDWYDRYHCYQDALADPDGIERGRGRLYRVRFGDTRPQPAEDLGKQTDSELTELSLHGPSEYHRHTARRLLGERLIALPSDSATVVAVRSKMRNTNASRLDRLRSAWILSGGQQLDTDSIVSLQTFGKSGVSYDSTLDAWCIRWMGERTDWDWDRWRQELARYQKDDAVDDMTQRVLLQFAIAIGKLQQTNSHSPTTGSKSPAGNPSVDQERIQTLLMLGGYCSQDPVVPAVAWQNVLKIVSSNPKLGIQALMDFLRSSTDTPTARNSRRLYTARVMNVLFDSPATTGEAYAGILQSAISSGNLEIDEQKGQLIAVTRRIIDGGFSPSDVQAIRRTIDIVKTTLPQEVLSEISQLSAAVGDRHSVPQVSAVALDSSIDAEERLLAFHSLLYGGNTSAAQDVVLKWLERTETDPTDLNEFRQQLLLSWARSPSATVAKELISRVGRLDSSLRSTVLEVLSQRSTWSLELLQAVESGVVGKDEINFHQMQRLASSDSPEVRNLAVRLFGQIRAGTRQDRQSVIQELQEDMLLTEGEPVRGSQVFQRVCAACHKIYGVGADVGPDITRNGRNSWEQLLQNVLDPSLVIGPAYQARVLVTSDGRVLTGVPVEESATRVVLKIQGGKVETIARGDIEEYHTSDVSLMPEGIEKQLSRQELIDLFQFLSLDRPPDDEAAKWISGAPVFKSQ